MKKNISSLTLIDMTEFKNRIDNINKMVLPENMFKNKKWVEFIHYYLVNNINYLFKYIYLTIYLLNEALIKQI